MRVKITYVHHNCFLLDCPQGAMLFDYPSAEHRVPEAEPVVREGLAGKDAWIFFSHSHADHCTAGVLGPARGAGSVRYVLSYDVPDMVPELDLEGAAVVDPDEGEYASGTLSVRGLESTDLGVAFLIRLGGLKVYYGGDLAEWAWQGLDSGQLRHEREYFRARVEDVRRFEPDVLFTDYDLRLENRAGAKDMLEAVKPKVFVPMHGFGNTGELARETGRLEAPGVRVFVYHDPGDLIEIDL
jgi:L-ascorbate metabolism protein UlaG (beta-lactamase superfamily)